MLNFIRGLPIKGDMSNPGENQPKFNPDIAKQLLQTIDKFPIEFFCNYPILFTVK